MPKFPVLLLTLLCCSLPASARPLVAVQSGQPTGAGRVVATITTLQGSVHMPGVEVELRTASPQATVLAKTTTDGSGLVTFPDVPPGRYIVTATRPGFVPRNSAEFDVRANDTSQVLLDIELTFVMPEVEVRAPLPASPTNSVQPVSMSDMLAGSVFETAPIEGDDFQSLLQLLPGVVRGPDGRLRIKGGQPSQSALQVSSASLIDPSSGDFDLDLPGQSVESVEVLANPFAAEYGRFSTSVTQVRTRRGTNDWAIKPGNLMPRFRKSFSGVRGFEPRFSMRGPIKRDRAFIAQDLQFRYVATPVKSLAGEPDIELTSFDSFTRVDTVVSARHTLGDTDREQWEVDSTGKERDPWQRTNYLLCKGLNDGELYTFTTSSKGGLDAVARLCKDYAPFMATKPNEWPVIEIGTDSYAHPNKDFGRIKVPTFKIAGFEPKATFAPDLGEQQDADVDELPEVAPAPKPAAKRNRI